MVTENLFSSEQVTTSSDDHYTPKHIFERLGLEFDLDVAAPPGGIPWIPAKRYYTMHDDGLSQPWSGRIWMNPPYSKTTRWVERFIEHGDGVALISLFRSKWINPAWEKLDGIVLLEHGLKFHLPNGKLKSITVPSFLVAMGDSCVERLAAFGRLR
jgi:hypothetical protein